MVDKDSNRVQCPKCKELIVKGASKCPFCKSRLKGTSTFTWIILLLLIACPFCYSFSKSLGKQVNENLEVADQAIEFETCRNYSMNLALLSTDVAKENWEKCQKDYAEILKYSECITKAKQDNPNIEDEILREQNCAKEYEAVINKK